MRSVSSDSSIWRARNTKITESVICGFVAMRPSEFDWRCRGFGMHDAFHAFAVEPSNRPTHPSTGTVLVVRVLQPRMGRWPHLRMRMGQCHLLVLAFFVQMQGGFGAYL